MVLSRSTGQYPLNEEFISWLELAPELLDVSFCCEDSSCCCGSRSRRNLNGLSGEDITYIEETLCSSCTQEIAAFVAEAEKCGDGSGHCDIAGSNAYIRDFLDRR